MNFSLKLALLATIACSTNATINWGKVGPEDWLVSYNTATYPTTLKFCEAWRSACIDLVGPLDRHHGMNCNLQQPSGKLYTVCTAVQKDANGNPEKGGYYYDFTEALLNPSQASSSPNLAKIVKSPKKPVKPWNGSN